MTAWSEMSPMEFDARLAPTSKARKFVETAPGTMFPRLLPPPKLSPAATYWARIEAGMPGTTTDPLGTPDMFATLEEA